MERDIGGLTERSIFKEINLKKKFINEEIIFKDKIGRIRDIKIHQMEIYFYFPIKATFGECNK